MTPNHRSQLVSRNLPFFLTHFLIKALRRNCWNCHFSWNSARFLDFQQSTETSCCAKNTTYLFALEQHLRRCPSQASQAGISASESDSPDHRLFHATVGDWEKCHNQKRDKYSNCYFVLPCAQEWWHPRAESCSVQLNQYNNTHHLKICAEGC